MTDNQTNPETTAKKKTDRKRLVWNVLKVFFWFILLNIAYPLGAAIPLSMSARNDYCYTIKLMGPSTAETYRRDIETIKSEKLPGWEEKLKIKKEDLYELTKDDDLFIRLLPLFCGDLKQYNKFELFFEEGERILEISRDR